MIKLKVAKFTGLIFDLPPISLLHRPLKPSPHPTPPLHPPQNCTPSFPQQSSRPISRRGGWINWQIRRHHDPFWPTTAISIACAPSIIAPTTQTPSIPAPSHDSACPQPTASWLSGPWEWRLWWLRGTRCRNPGRTNTHNNRYSMRNRPGMRGGRGRWGRRSGEERGRER